MYPGTNTSVGMSPPTARHAWRLPDPSFTPVAPFTTHQAKSAAGVTSIVTDRIVDYNKQSTTWSIVDFSQRYRPELEEMARHKAHQKAAMHRIDASMRKENAARQREAQRRDAQPKCIPALGSDGDVPTSPATHASMWQRMSRLCAADDRDEAFWMPHQRGGHAFLHGDEAAYRRWETASHDGSGDEGDDATSPNVQRVKRQLQSQLTVVRPRQRDTLQHSPTSAPANASGLEMMSPTVPKRGVRSSEQDALVASTLPLSQAIPMTIVRLHGFEAATDSFPPEGPGDDVASTRLGLLANPTELLPRLDFGPDVQGMLQELLLAPRPLLQCYDDATLVERCVTLEILDPYKMLAAQKAIAHRGIGGGPSVFNTGDADVAAKRGPRVYFSILAGRDRRSAPVLSRFALDQLVDVTLGCGFSPSLTQHLRTLEDAEKCRSMRLEKHDEDAMVRRVQQFVRQNRPKPFKATASAPDKEAQRRAVGLFCQTLEQTFPLLVGPPVSFAQRSVIPSHRCFSLWFLSDDAETATALHFAVEDEREGAMWVSTLRALLRLNDRARVASILGVPSVPTGAAAGQSAPLQRLHRALQIPTSLEDRRWACHCAIDEQQRRMERGELPVTAPGAIGSSGGLGFVFKSALRDLLTQTKSKYDPPSDDTVV